MSIIYVRINVCQQADGSRASNYNINAGDCSSLLSATKITRWKSEIEFKPAEMETQSTWPSETATGWW